MASEKISLTKEGARKYAYAQIDAMLATYDDGEWFSFSQNVTAGPKEAPVFLLAILPGTTRENAERIQNGFIVAGQQLNKG